ncbi:MAG: biotin-dependent carboxyltransferase family protein [Chitinophagaceae bacterium]
MAIRILKPGIFDTIQDKGRYGFACWGINPGGVMDPYAAAVANALVGNGPDSAILELHFPAAQLLLEEDALISICGADFKATGNGQPLPLWQPILVRKNVTIHFEKCLWGARCYVAVCGGFHLPEWLGSYSTNTKAKVGGYQGRALMKQDRIPFAGPGFSSQKTGPLHQDLKSLPWEERPEPEVYSTTSFPIMKGREWDLFTAHSREQLLQAEFSLSSSADRMGFPLEGPAIECEVPAELVSSGVTTGTIQVLPNGKMIILMADHQTTGGYPRIGQVSLMALLGLAQYRPGSRLTFQLTDEKTSEEQYLTQQNNLSGVLLRCREKIKPWLPS